ncbi:fibronectin type III domain-containing protein, partial [Parasegetibacter sp. NRK P23]|uniref:fibronectin type III domain-containing protein n=1 Tax=Parasegetibacter sp. NRK P23 TaxID=2942999 RepID=UPI002043D62D
MKQSYSPLRLAVLLLLLLIENFAHAQTGVLNPDDPIVVYNASAPPETPPFGTLSKWVKTNRVSFNTTSYKAYFYKGMSFRLKFPKSYKDSLGRGKKYPIMVFFHGVGEKGSIYDNEAQLVHGGQRFMNNVDNGSFDGFLFYPQTSSSSGGFNTNHYSAINELIENYFIPELGVDPFRVIVNGLSGGGGATWQMLKLYPTLVAAGTPISAVSNYDADPNNIANVKYTPIWLFQGGLDKAPAPFTARGVVNSFKAAGANITYTEYPTLGHSSWNTAWAEADYLPFIKRAHKANPWPLNGRTEFCPNTTISQVIGVTPGFDGYEWSKNGQVIAGANNNTYTATSIGTYACRVLRGTVWSDWSPIPVVIKEKGATVPPAITISGGGSPLIPSPSHTDGVQLEVPEGFIAYSWQKEGEATVLGTTRFLQVQQPGAYKVMVSEENGCASEFSAPFVVKNANGTDAPPALLSVSADAVSKTKIRVSWNQVQAPANNETGFEVYQSTAAGGTYQLIATTAADSTGFTIEQLRSNTIYYFKVRAINNNGASAVSNEVNARTLSDIQAPTTPLQLQVISTTRNAVELSWNESTDDVAVTGYEVYVDGLKYYETENTYITVYNLEHGSAYNFRVKAKDAAGNLSAFSNQATARPLLNGLSFKYYITTENWTALPNYDSLTPYAVGTMPAVSINERTQDDRFSYLWEGYITVPVTGTYYFRTASDEGSKVWLGNLNQVGSPYAYVGGPVVVNNDGNHGNTTVTSQALTLQAGTYPIAIAYFERTSGQSMTFSWRTPLTGSGYATVPNSAFIDPAPADGVAPATPGALSATALGHNKVQLSWNDRSSNEVRFEVWRSEDATGGFTMVGTTGANNTAFTDSLELQPATNYFYKVRAVGEFGESAFFPVDNDALGVWRLNNSYIDSISGAKPLIPSSGPVFDNNNKKEGSHALVFNGTNQHADFTSVANDYLRGAYNKKSVAFWMKATTFTGGRNVIDIGGRDYGLAVRLDSNKIFVGVANANVRKSISVPYTSTNWEHVTVVYDTNTLKLYLNGTLVAGDSALGFNAIAAGSNSSSVARVNGTNAFNFGTGRFAGAIDDLSIFGKALTSGEINLLKENKYDKLEVRTEDLPAGPQAPAQLNASAVSTSRVHLTWNDASNNETGFEIYRSANTADGYALFATVPANSTSFADTTLPANTTYFYMVRAVNEGGHSAYSNEDSATTWNSAPVVTAIAQKNMCFGTQLNLPVSATDADPETLTI